MGTVWLLATMGKLLLALCIQVFLVACVHCWVELTTTFPSYNAQPRTEKEAQDAGWTKIEDATDRFAGVRYYPPMPVPDKALIYDTSGTVVGFQSVVPEGNFVSGDCTYNEFYARDTIAGQKFCMSTVYFQDPRTISVDKVAGDEDDVQELHLQKRESWKTDADLLRIPHYYQEAEANQDKWILHKYFLGMGHHVTKLEDDMEDCLRATPFQALYAWDDDHRCVNTGFVSSHLTTNTGDGWEKPGDIAIRLIFSNPPQCVLDAGAVGNATTMHTFLGGSTTYCVTD